MEGAGMSGMSQMNEIQIQHVIATLIWTGGIVHATDHWTFYHCFKNHGMYCSMVPYQPASYSYLHSFHFFCDFISTQLCNLFFLNGKK